MLASARQQATSHPVVLSRIEVVYPVIAEFARVGGTVTVRVAVRPDGSVSETTLLQDVQLLSACRSTAVAVNPRLFDAPNADGRSRKWSWGLRDG